MGLRIKGVQLYSQKVFLKIFLHRDTEAVDRGSAYKVTDKAELMVVVKGIRFPGLQDGHILCQKYGYKIGQ